MNSLVNAFRTVRLNSGGEEDNSDDGGFVRRYVPSESDDEHDPDDFGYYDGSNAFHILVDPNAADVLVPKSSDRIPGGLDVFTQTATFRLKAGESKTVWLGFGIVVPRNHTASFVSRAGLYNATGVMCPETVLGPGKVLQ